MPNERKLTKSELKKREDIVMDMKKNKRELTKRYGKDAEAVMYGRATRLAKQKSESMNPDKIREMIKSSLKNPKKADLNKDGKLSSYEEKRGAAIEKSMKEMEMNDPILVKMRAAAAKDEKPDFGKEYGEAVQKAYNSSNLAKLNFLRKERTQLMRDMEQEAEPEGGPIADEYGAKLNRIDKAIAKLSGRKEMTYDQAIAEGDVNESLNPEVSKTLNRFIKAMAKRYDYTEQDAVYAIMAALKQRDFDGLNEATRQDLDMVSSVSKRRAKSALMNPSNDGSKVYGLDKDGKRVELKSVDDLDKFMKFELDADLNEDIDLGHQDNEPGMIKAQLYHIGSYAMELYKMMDGLEDMGEVDFPSWWQSKITTAENMIAGAKHYLEFELKEPAIDAFVSMSDELEEELYTPNEMGDMAIEKESASGAFEENLDLEAKVDALQRLKRGEIDTLPSDEDAKAALVKRVLDKLSASKPVKEDRKAVEYIRSIEDEDEREEERKRMFDDEKESLKEYTNNNFKGSEIISNVTSPDMFAKKAIEDLFPNGVASEGDAIEALKAHDASPIKARMGRFAPMFVHVQYHDFESGGEEYRAHQTQYYNSNFKDTDPTFNPKVTKLVVDKMVDGKGEEIGTILVKTDEYVKDLKNLNIINKAM